MKKSRNSEDCQRHQPKNMKNWTIRGMKITIIFIGVAAIIFTSFQFFAKNHEQTAAAISPTPKTVLLPDGVGIKFDGTNWVDTGAKIYSDYVFTGNNGDVERARNPFSLDFNTVCEPELYSNGSCEGFFMAYAERDENGENAEYKPLYDLYTGEMAADAMCRMPNYPEWDTDENGDKILDADGNPILLSPIYAMVNSGTPGPSTNCFLFPPTRHRFSLQKYDWQGKFNSPYAYFVDGQLSDFADMKYDAGESWNEPGYSNYISDEPDDELALATYALGAKNDYTVADLEIYGFTASSLTTGAPLVDLKPAAQCDISSRTLIYGFIDAVSGRFIRENPRGIFEDDDSPTPLFPTVPQDFATLCIDPQPTAPELPPVVVAPPSTGFRKNMIK